MTRLFGSFAALAIAAALATPTLKADPPLCPTLNLVMNGTYTMSGTGTVFGTSGGPLAFVGVITYNGDGTGTLMSVTDNLNGAVGRASSLPATFTVNRDCTGSKTIGSGPSAQHFDFVITRDGNTITFVGTDAFAVVSGTAVRISR
jgi:hypothetical protein